MCNHPPPRRRPPLQLLNDAGADGFAMADNHRTPLLEAAAAGAADCLTFLAEEVGVPVKDEIVPDESASGEHALLLAAGGGHVAAVEALLRQGAKVNRVDKAGRSALWAAARCVADCLHCTPVLAPHAYLCNPTACHCAWHHVAVPACAACAPPTPSNSRTYDHFHPQRRPRRRRARAAAPLAAAEAHP